MAAAGTGELFQQLALLLALATLSHFTIKRFRQPTIVGEIALGVVLGPSILGYFGIHPFGEPDEGLTATFATLGAIFLLFVIGLESDFRAIYTKKNIEVAVGGVALPFAFGFLTAFFLVPPNPAEFDQFIMAMFVGATLTATSTAIAAAVLLDLGLMKERVAQTILGAAVVDDVLGLMVLSIVVGASGGSIDPISITILIVTALAFLVVGSAVGMYLFRRVVVRIEVEGLKLGVKHGGFLIAMAIAFLYAFIAESIGLSAIIGAFLAGALFADTPFRGDFREGAGYLGAIFTPIFFISLGLQVNLWAAVAEPALFLFAIVLTVVAIVTKVVGCGVAAYQAKMTRNESLAVGWGMTPRGEVGLIVALTALTAFVITPALFAVMVVVMIVVSVIPAPFLKKALLAVDEERRRATERGRAEEEGEQLRPFDELPVDDVDPEKGPDLQV
jgi:Kef-type K+ transport system membrane component KefB